MKKGGKGKTSTAAPPRNEHDHGDDQEDHDHGDEQSGRLALASLPPKQDLNERRRIRQEYRRLNESIKGNSVNTK